MAVEHNYDYIVLGAGIFGLHAARLLCARGHKVAVLEYDNDIFSRASYINQARVHQGYHYPRSFTTALKAAEYFDRFCREFPFAINDRFRKIYAIARHHSHTSGEQFRRFCKTANIPCTPTRVEEFFDPWLVEAAFETREFSLDGAKLREWFFGQLSGQKKCQLYCGVRIQGVGVQAEQYCLDTNQGSFSAPTVVNATYASINQVAALFGVEPFDLKYEISEIIRCGVNQPLINVGLTLMDGPFFSVMPFGHSGRHSLTSVTFTHHKTGLDKLPLFPCQQRNPDCTPANLANCNNCPARPQTAWSSMHQLARKYLHPRCRLDYIDSLFSIKPILKSARLDDSRPTVVVEHSHRPRLLSVLSGKINTIYDLEEVLP